MINTVIFDLDGTLLNTLTDLRTSVNFALQKHALPERPLDDIRRFAGNGVERLVELSVPGGKEHPDFPAILADFKAHYLAHCNDQTAPYEGIPSLLAELQNRGYRMAVVTNKLADAAAALVAQHFGTWINVAIGASDSVRKKPAPDTVFAALHALHADAAHAVYVGDSEVDIATAKNASLPCIAVAWGFRTRAEQLAAGATIFAETPGEVLESLRQIGRYNQQNAFPDKHIHKMI